MHFEIMQQNISSLCVVHHVNEYYPFRLKQALVYPLFIATQAVITMENYYLRFTSSPASGTPDTQYKHRGKSGVFHFRLSIWPASTTQEGKLV